MPTKLTKADRAEFARRYSSVAALHEAFDSILRNPDNHVGGKAKNPVLLRVARYTDLMLAEVRARREEAAAPFIGELCRDGETVFYIVTATGTEECADRWDAIYRLIDMGKVE